MNNCDNCPNYTDGVCCHATNVAGDETSIASEIAHRQMLSDVERAKHVPHQPLNGILVLGGNY